VDVAGGDGGSCTDARLRPIQLTLPNAVRVAAYCLSHSGGCHAPSNWVLEGSKDGASWKILHNAVNDRSLSSARASWTINPAEDDFYKQFQLRCTGGDVGGSTCFCFHIRGLELFGEVAL